MLTVVLPAPDKPDDTGENYSNVCIRKIDLYLYRVRCFNHQAFLFISGSTCKPHSAASEAASGPHYLSTLVSAHMMGLIGHICGSLHSLYKKKNSDTFTTFICNRLDRTSGGTDKNRASDQETAAGCFISEEIEIRKLHVHDT